jgi:hypothetical protein
LPTFMNWKPYCDVGLVVRGRPALFVFTLLMGAKFGCISLRSKFRLKIIRLKIRHLNNFTENSCVGCCTLNKIIYLYNIKQ